MDFSGSGNRWAWDYITPERRRLDYKWCISAIFPANLGMDD